MASSHESDVFQSSCTSWSSQIIDVDTVERNQRIAGSSQDSQYRRVYSS